MTDYFNFLKNILCVFFIFPLISYPQSELSNKLMKTMGFEVGKPKGHGSNVTDQYGNTIITQNGNEILDGNGNLIGYRNKDGSITTTNGEIISSSGGEIYKDGYVIGSMEETGGGRTVYKDNYGNPVFETQAQPTYENNILDVKSPDFSTSGVYDSSLEKNNVSNSIYTGQRSLGNKRRQIISSPSPIIGTIDDNLNYDAIGSAYSSGNQPVIISNETANQIGEGIALAIQAGQIKNAKKRLRTSPQDYRINPTVEKAFSIYNDVYTLWKIAGISENEIITRYDLSKIFIEEHSKLLNLYEGNYRLYRKENNEKNKLFDANIALTKKQRLFNFSDVAVKISLLRKKNKVSKSIVELNKIDQFKYAVILESESFHKEVVKTLKKKWNEKLPKLVVIENEKSIPDDLKLNPNLALYIDISADAFYEMFTKTRIFMYDNESNLLFKKNYTKKAASRSIKLFVDELNGLNYRYDKSLVKKYVKKVNKEKKLISNAVKKNNPVKPVSSNKVIISKSNIKYSLTKKEAIEEIKSLKDLLDSNILTKEEYEKRAEVLKKIILKN